MQTSRRWCLILTGHSLWAALAVICFHSWWVLQGCASRRAHLQLWTPDMTNASRATTAHLLYIVNPALLSYLS